MSVVKITHLKKSMRPPFSAIDQTSPMPPARMLPAMIRARKPLIMIVTWNTSVHNTAFIPPFSQDKLKQFLQNIITNAERCYGFISFGQNVENLNSTGRYCLCSCASFWGKWYSINMHRSNTGFVAHHWQYWIKSALGFVALHHFVGQYLLVATHNFGKYSKSFLGKNVFFFFCRTPFNLAKW